MRHLVLSLIFLFATSIVLAQTPPLPRDGEARADRSEVSTIWVNPDILQPSVFFNKEEVQHRSDRKWWRRKTASPVPDLDHLVFNNEQEELLNSESSINTLLQPLNFGENIPPVVPLWNREINEYQNR